MSFHLCAFTATVGNVANTDVTALADNVVSIFNSHFVFGQDRWLLGQWAGSATLLRARLNSPKLAQWNGLYCRPFNLAALPADNPNLMDMRPNPFQLPGLEELRSEVTSGVAMTERFTHLVWTTDRMSPPAVGEQNNLRFTSTTAATANAWTLITPVFDNIPQAGAYAIVGAELQSTNGIAFRLTFDNQADRPGGLMANTLGRRTAPMFYDSDFGQWGVFKPPVMPRIEVLANAADASFEGYLRMIRVGSR